MTSSKVVSKGPCEACGSSDANVLYEDNHSYCFSCQTYSKGDTMATMPDNRQPPVKGVYQNHFTEGTYQALTDRKISENTCKFYGVTVRGDKHIYPYHDDSGSRVANKVRQTTTKSFFVEGSLPPPPVAAHLPHLLHEQCLALLLSKLLYHTLTHEEQ